MIGTIVRPVKKLKDFAKLKAGKSETIKFIINKEKLSFFNRQLQLGAEFGAFDVMVGASSADIRLSDNFELMK